MRRVLRILSLPVVVYLTWLGMMAVHEFGHVLHAWLSGASVLRVSLPLIGFSQTFFRFNPHAHFVVWGGPLWGSILPLAMWLAVPRHWRVPRRVIQFFAGFCLIANGAYLGIGWTMRAGDAADLLSHGTPVWVMISFGVIAMSTGLYLWHLLGVPPVPHMSESANLEPASDQIRDGSIPD